MFCLVQKIRAVVRDIEQSTRAIHTAIQAAHHCAVKDSMFPNKYFNWYTVVHDVEHALDIDHVC